MKLVENRNCEKLVRKLCNFFSGNFTKFFRSFEFAEPVLVLMLRQTSGIFEVIALAIRANMQSIGHCRYISRIRKLVLDERMVSVKWDFAEKFERDMRNPFYAGKFI